MSMHEEPADGGLVREPTKVPVPDDVREAVKTIIRWAGDDPEREGLLDTPTAWRGRGRNMPRAMARIRLCISAERSMKSAAMTRSCF
jgi:GTP cyclohydrolase I